MKNEALEQMKQQAGKAEALLKQLANANRLLVLCQLASGRKNVSELSEILDISQSALSQHLAKLRQAELVVAEKKGKEVEYRLASIEVQSLLNTLYLLYCHQPK
jgi:ArsR family transcriptional regulator, virulence genes transcriptional regulator